MKSCAFYASSSYMEASDIYVPDDFSTGDAPTTYWRALQSSVTCVLDSDNKKTGYAHIATLEEVSLVDQNPTGNTKPNVPTDPDYRPDYLDIVNCQVENSYLKSFEIQNTTDKGFVLTLIGLTDNIRRKYIIGDGQSVSQMLPPQQYSLSMAIPLLDGGRYFRLNTVEPAPVYFTGSNLISVNPVEIPASFVLDIANPGDDGYVQP